MKTVFRQKAGTIEAEKYPGNMAEGGRFFFFFLVFDIMTVVIAEHVHQFFTIGSPAKGRKRAVCLDYFSFRAAVGRDNVYGCLFIAGRDKGDTGTVGGPDRRAVGDFSKGILHDFIDFQIGDEQPGKIFLFIVGDCLDRISHPGFIGRHGNGIDDAQAA